LIDLVNEEDLSENIEFSNDLFDAQEVTVTRKVAIAISKLVDALEESSKDNSDIIELEKVKLSITEFGSLNWQEMKSIARSSDLNK